MMLVTIPIGNACPSTPHPAPVPGQTSTLTLRLDPSGEPLDEAIVAYRVHVRKGGGGFVELIPELNQPRQPGIQDFLLTEIPVGAITVVLEGVNAEGEVIAFFVQDLELTSEPGTVTVTQLLPKVERIEDLGFGFRRVLLAKPSGSNFESIGHWEYLYYRDQELCLLGECSVSPSGSYVIFQDGRSGNLFLYRRADGRQTQLTSQFVALVKRFDWDENAGRVEVHFTTGLSESYSIQVQP